MNLKKVKSFNINLKNQNYMSQTNQIGLGNKQVKELIEKLNDLLAN